MIKFLNFFEVLLYFIWQSPIWLQNTKQTKMSVIGVLLAFLFDTGIFIIYELLCRFKIPRISFWYCYLI